MNKIGDTGHDLLPGMKQAPAMTIFNQGDINRLQQMLDKEIAKRITSGIADTIEMRRRATVQIPMKVWKGEICGGLHCNVDTVEAIEQGIL